MSERPSFSFLAISLFFVGFCGARADVAPFNPVPNQTSVVERDSPPEIYQAAGEAFEAGDFARAISLYEKLALADLSSESLFLNLGTAYYRQGSSGKAALWYRRASLLSPEMPELKQNLGFLRQRLGFREFSDSEWKRALLFRSPRLLQGAGWMLLWAGLFGWLAVLSGQQNKWKPVVISVSILSLTGAAAFFFLNGFRSAKLAPENFATVVIPETSALAAPAPDSSVVVALPEGSEVRILQDTGPWIYASIPGDIVGWVHHTSIEKNWPIPKPQTKELPISLLRDKGGQDSVVFSR